jgi:hypothetical protein
MHSLLAGEKRLGWKEYQQEYFDLFKPPKKAGRKEDAPYSEEFMAAFEFAMKRKIISTQHLARLGLQALRDSGAEI